MKIILTPEDYNKLKDRTGLRRRAARSMPIPFEWWTDLAPIHLWRISEHLQKQYSRLRIQSNCRFHNIVEMSISKIA